MASMTAHPPDELAQRFQDYVLSGVKRLKAGGYNPTLFRRLVAEHGSAVTTAKVLLNGRRHTSYGFQRLWELGELESSLEFAVCLPGFRSLFTFQEQDKAEQRLLLHDFPLQPRLRLAQESPPSWVSR